MLPLEGKPLLSPSRVSTLNVASTDGHYSGAKSLLNAVDIVNKILATTEVGPQARSGSLYVGMFAGAKILNNTFNRDVVDGAQDGGE